MEIIHLPAAVVPYLNGLIHPGSDLAAERTDLELTVQFMQAWWEFERTYHLDDKEAGQLENLGVLLTEIPELLNIPDFKTQRDVLVPGLYQVVGMMEAIRQRRERAEYSQQPPVNDLILAGVACIQKQGELRAVSERLDRLTEYYKNLRQALRANQARLKPEVAEAIQGGLEHVKEAMAEILAAVEEEDLKALEEGLAMLREGSQITQHLIDWHKADEEKHGQRYQKYCLPVGGPMLELSLETAKQVPKEQWERGIRGLRDGTLPELAFYWHQSQVKVLLPAEERAAALDRVDQGLLALEQALDTMEDPERTREEGLEALESSLQELSDAFLDILEHSPDPSHLRGTQPGEYFELVMGLLRGTVPLLAIPEMLHASPPPDSSWEPIIEPIMRYSMAEETELLYESLLALVEKYPQPVEEAAPNSWNCPFCDHPNPVENRICGSCNSSPGTLEASNWEA